MNSRTIDKHESLRLHTYKNSANFGSSGTRMCMIHTTYHNNMLCIHWQSAFHNHNVQTQTTTKFKQSMTENVNIS